MTLDITGLVGYQVSFNGRFDIFIQKKLCQFAFFASLFQQLLHDLDGDGLVGRPEHGPVIQLVKELVQLLAVPVIESNSKMFNAKASSTSELHNKYKNYETGKHVAEYREN